MEKKRFVCCAATIWALALAGCATQEAVKKDESMVPAVATKAPAAKLPKETVAPIKATAVGTAAAGSSAKEAAKEATSGQEQVKAALERIYFDFDSAALSSQARGTLAKNADYLQKHGDAKIRIEGN